MKAVRYHQHGDPAVLKVEDLAVPTPGDNQVLIKVSDAGVNFADCLQRRGTYPAPVSLPATPGFEIAGTIEAVGKGVSDFKVGDRVVAVSMTGGYCEYALAETNLVFNVPDAISLTTAAALPGQALTAYFIFVDAPLGKGESVAINAAAGGVGSVAAQIAKIMGAGQVIGITGSEAKRASLVKQGYDNAVSTDDSAWTAKIKDATEGAGVDIYLDSVGGDLFHQGLTCLKDNGRLIVYGRASGQPTMFDPQQMMQKNQSVRGFSLWKYIFQPERLKAGLAVLFKAVEDGQLQLDVAKYKLADASEVHSLMETRKTTGKLILQP